MNAMLKQAYDLGVLEARAAFEKRAAEGDALTSILGALPLAGAPLAGYASGKTTPWEPKEVAARTGSKAALGQTLGGLGGAALGAGLGGGGVALAKHLGADIDMEPGRAAMLGALLGGGLGMAGGGAYGAYKGRQEAKETASGERLEDLMEARQEEVAKQQRNQRILKALMQSHQMGSYGLPLRVRIPPQLAAAIQAQRGQQ